MSAADRAPFTTGHGSIEERLAAVQAEIEALQLLEEQLQKAMADRLNAEFEKGAPR